LLQNFFVMILIARFYNLIVAHLLIVIGIHLDVLTILYRVRHYHVRIVAAL
jgi:hypothetical protein